MSSIKLKYPAIFRKSKGDDQIWNVSIPDVYGAVTCGKTFEDAIEMAKDLLRCLYIESPHQFLIPTSLEETKKNFPNEIVEIVETEVTIKDDVYFEPPKPRVGTSRFFALSNRIYETVGSLVDYRTNKIYLLNNKGERIKEILDIERKYKLLQIFRSDMFQSVFTPELRLCSIEFFYGKRLVKNFKVDSEIDILNNTFCILLDRKTDDNYFCLKLDSNSYYCLDDGIDPGGSILKIYLMSGGLKKYNITSDDKRIIIGAIKKIYSSLIYNANTNID